MKTLSFKRPTRHAVGFRVVRDDNAHRVVWLDQIDGETVNARDSIKSATPKLARERLRRLEKAVQDQQPRVRLHEIAGLFYPRQAGKRIHS